MGYNAKPQLNTLNQSISWDQRFIGIKCIELIFEMSAKQKLHIPLERKNSREKGTTTEKDYYSE